MSNPKSHASPIALRKLCLCLSSVLIAGAGLALLFGALNPPAASASASAAQANVAPAFFLQRPFGAGSDPTYSVAVGDMNGDGALDLVVGNNGEQSVVYLNDGVGNFDWPGSARPFGGSSDWTTSVAVGDVNRDGALDLIVGGSLGQQSAVYLNDGVGNFNWPGSARPFGSSSDWTTSVAAGDLNGDGALDLVVGNKWQQSAVYLNDGAGHFDWPGSARPFGDSSDPPQRVTVGDLNGDGALDIVAVASMYQQSMVYLNDGHGEFYGGTVNCSTPPANVRCFGTNPGTGGNWTNSASVGDMNGDGALDIVTGNWSSQSVVYLNDGTGNFPNTPPYTRTVGTDSDRTTSVAVGDMNGDGALDIVARIDEYNPGQQSMVYLNDGAGHFNWSGSAHPFGDSLNQTTSVAVADVNGDGALDIVVGNNQRQSTVYLNDGAGDFDSPGPARNTLPFGDSVNSGGVVGDVNGDGALDVVSNGGVIYLNDGRGSFVITRTHSGGGGVIALGDVDGDGALDIVAGNYMQQNVVYLNGGTGSFSNTVPYTRPFGTDSDRTASVAVGDMNGDGALDIVQGNGCDYYGDNCQQSVLYLNDGAGNFDWPGSARHFGGSLDNTWSVAVADVNGDGAPDIVQGNMGRPDSRCHCYPGAQSVVYLNDGAGNFDWPGSARLASDRSDPTGSVAVGDVNGDGAPDLIVGNYGQQSAVYLNDGAGNFNWPGSARLFGGSSDQTRRVVVGDVNGDGAPDLIVGNDNQPSVVYVNDGAGNFDWPGQARNTRPFGRPLGSVSSSVGVAAGDMNGDGALDLVLGRYGSQGLVYLNGLAGDAWLVNNPPQVALSRPNLLANANFVYANPVQRVANIPITYTLSDPEGEPVRFIRASYSLDGGGYWQPAVAANGTITMNLIPRRYFRTAYLTPTIAIPDNGVITSTLDLTPTSPLTATDVKVWVAISHPLASQLRLVLQGPTGVTATLLAPGTLYDPLNEALLFDDTASRAIGSSATGWFTGAYRPATPLAGFNGLNAYGTWTLLVQDTTADLTGIVRAWGLQVQNSAGTYVFNWDVFGSGFFGQSDNVAFRMEAYPALTTASNGVPVFQRPYASATSLPFRARGTQVQVISGTTPISNAIVYRLPKGQEQDGNLIRSGSGEPFYTDLSGYLMGRGQINAGDRLLALAPISTSTQGFSLYYTNGKPQNLGVDAFTFGGSGLQVITVSAQHPLYLFDLDVSLEWDAHNDSAYLDQLTANLQRASQYLYDFTDGQAALGDVYVYQNTAGWDYSHITLHANNRLRPFAIIGGIVLTDTFDPHPPTTDTLAYGPGQVTIGSTWNRYGRPGQMLSDDWSIVLAHELSHYLFYQDDVYLGLDTQGKLIPVNTCTGSAMGDLYDRPQNTEFIFNQTFWNANCANTLAGTILSRTEWSTLRTWYPALITPTAILSGPSEMPFNLTTVSVFDPLTPTATLADPTFYVNYVGNALASADARAYLLQSDAGGDWLLNLGSPGGGQSRIVARGAKPGDRLCVFDSAQRQYGCEPVVFGNDQLPLTYDPAWNPMLQVTPINSVTLRLTVSNVPTSGLTLKARLFPDQFYAPPTITLVLTGNVYLGNFPLTQTGVINGNVQVWASGRLSETIMAYSVGGNLGGTFAGGASRGSGGIGASRGSGGIGASRGSGGIGASRGSGGIGASRGSGGIGASRGSGGIGQARSGHAPLLSPDGQLIFFTNANTEFGPGALFAIQATAGLPTLPPGRTQVGAGYNLVASPGITLPAGSISLQYLSNDVAQAGATEADLALYFHDGTAWKVLATTTDPTFDVVVAPSQGPGLYALLASVQIPLPRRGWNLFPYPFRDSQPITTALASIANKYALVFGYDLNDPLDPWKVYTPRPIAGYVVDLHDMRFPQAYWISTTTPITLYLAPAEVDAALGGLTPPATFYGAISATTDFTPTVGQSVVAVVNGLICGQGFTQAYDGRIVYVVDVNGDSDGALPGCGRPGQSVTFYVNDRRMAPAGVWNNNDLVPLPLAPASEQFVYLPLIRR